MSSISPSSKKEIYSLIDKVIEKYLKKAKAKPSVNYGNPFGVDDMVGNVWEWCFDPWHSLGKSPAGDPDKDKLRVIRGGSWLSSKEQSAALARRNNNSNTPPVVSVSVALAQNSKFYI